MTDLEENCWSEKVCQTCGSKLPVEQHTLDFAGTSKRYCSRLCFDQGLDLLATWRAAGLLADKRAPDLLPTERLGS